MFQSAPEPRTLDRYPRAPTRNQCNLPLNPIYIPITPTATNLNPQNPEPFSAIPKTLQLRRPEAERQSPEEACLPGVRRHLPRLLKVWALRPIRGGSGDP